MGSLHRDPYGFRDFYITRKYDFRKRRDFAGNVYFDVTV